MPRRSAFSLEFDLVTPFWGLIRTESDTRNESGSVEREVVSRVVLKKEVA
jgi:hypothetical protein